MPEPKSTEWPTKYMARFPEFPEYAWVIAAGGDDLPKVIEAYEGGEVQIEVEALVPLQTIRERLTSDEALKAAMDQAAYEWDQDTPDTRKAIMRRTLEAAFDRGFPDTKDKREQR